MMGNTDSQPESEDQSLVPKRGCESARVPTFQAFGGNESQRSLKYYPAHIQWSYQFADFLTPPSMARLTEYTSTHSSPIKQIASGQSPAKRPRLTDRDTASLPDIASPDIAHFRRPMFKSSGLPEDVPSRPQSDCILEDVWPTPTRVEWEDASAKDHSSRGFSDSLPTEATGPITSAVVKRGLKAKLSRFGSWMAHSEPMKTSSSLPNGLMNKKWSSLRSSMSLNSPLKLASKQKPPPRFMSLPRNSGRKQVATATEPASATSLDRTSCGSLNSLSDGRTPWPVPWLDAVFLPEFPNRAPLSEKDFVVLGTIANGAFGRVSRVRLKKQPDTVYAMKYALCNSPFVTQLHFAWQSRTNLYMVLHYVTGYGDLHQLWKDEGPFNEDMVALYAAEISCALDCIHNSSVIYRDLKMENILLDENGHVQIVDFGMAKWLHFGDHTRTICGTLYYMAPEILLGEYAHEVDWWSLGVLVHTLLTGEYPYSVGQDHTSTHIPLYKPPSNLSEDAQSLLRKLLQHDPKSRLSSLTQIRVHPFFRGLDLEPLMAKEIHPFDYLPRMRRCNTCNNEIDFDSVISGSTAAFDECYDLFNHFDALEDP